MGGSSVANGTPFATRHMPSLVSNAAKSATFETFETQHFRDKTMSAPAHIRKFRLAIRAPDNGHSLSAIFPVSPPRTAHFAKEQSGTDSEKAGDPDDRWRDRPATVPLWVHLEERPRLAGHAAHAKNSNSVTGLSARSSAMQRQTVRKSGPDDCSVPHRRFLERLK